MRQEALRLDNVITDDRVLTNLNNFNLHLFCGEVLGIVMGDDRGWEKLLCLLRRNTAVKFGRIYLKDRMVNSYRYSDNSFNKIHILSRKSRLIYGLNVIDNVFVLRKGFRQYVISPGRLAGQFNRLMAEFCPEIHIDPYSLTGSLTEYERCVVEVIKAVVQGIELFVMDNLSGILSEVDLTKFHKFLKTLAIKDYGIIYMGNHHEEVFSVSDRAVLMKEGSIIKIFEKEEMNDEKIFPYTVFSEKNSNMHGYFRRNAPGQMKIHAVTDQMKLCIAPESGESFLFQNMRTESVRDLTFEIKRGECVVLYDRSSKVLREFVHRIVSSAGDIKGEMIHKRTEAGNAEIEKKLWKYAVSIIEERPVESHIYMERSYIDNLCSFLDQRRRPVYISGRIRESIQKEYEAELGEALYENDLRQLDQKELYNLVYYRVLLQKPAVVFIIQPFAGADMYMRYHIMMLIRKLQEKGIAVAMIAFSISDCLHIADRVISLEDGVIIKETRQKKFSEIFLDI